MTIALAATDASRQMPAKRIRPKLAGSLMILDKHDGIPHVLMGRRAAGHLFMPNVYVFPGGKVDRTDYFVRTNNSLQVNAKAKMEALRPLLNGRQAHACAVAAIRETYEEVSLLLSSETDRTRDWAIRIESGYKPDLTPLRPVARAITPAGEVRRYDTHFFAVPRSAFADQEPAESDELQDLQWIPLSEPDRVPMHVITQRVFSDLTERVAQEGLILAAHGPVPNYRRLKGKFYRTIA